MEIHEEIKKAARLIREGKLVAFPTETVYGLGADALNPNAVAGIFELKERPSFDPLIVHIASIDDVQKLTVDYDKRIDKLAARFWPGPLTIVMKKSALVPDIVTAGLDTVGVRMPDSDIALDLIRECGCPLAAPSANKFGKLSPTNAAHVRKGLPGVDFVIDGGDTTVGIESTIIKLTKNGFVILRYGVITREDLEEVIPYDEDTKDVLQLAAPGMMDSHYSPDKPLYLESELESASIDFSRAAYLKFNGKVTSSYGRIIEMAPDGDLKKYAVRLFSIIHELQDSMYKYIVVQDVPEEGVGRAIMDRLRKASHLHISALRNET